MQVAQLRDSKSVRDLSQPGERYLVLRDLRAERVHRVVALSLDARALLPASQHEKTERQ